DGATSSAILVQFFSLIGINIPVYIPDRQKEGYGPNLPALMKLKYDGASVIITVDCGTTAFESLEAATEAGLKVIVIDHHMAEPRLPKGCLVINPNRFDETSKHGQLAAVGVTFLFITALNRALRKLNWFDKTFPEPNLMKFLGLVARGTICDVVPLTGLNRALVSQGLRVLQMQENFGITALSEIANISEPLNCFHAGFLLGPRVNAGGRVGEANLGVRLLTTSNVNEAKALALKLNEYNNERRDLEQTVFEQALMQAEQQDKEQHTLILVFGKNWHPGVIGIVAGRLREHFNKPSCVVTQSGGMGKGSGRSVKGVDLGSAIIAARQVGIVCNGGGHSMAAGFTVSSNKLDTLKKFLQEHILKQLKNVPLLPYLEFDSTISLAAATPELIRMLDQVGPFGAGNPQPRFVIPQVQIVQANIVGKIHVKCTLRGSDGTRRLNAIAFRSLDTALGKVLLNSQGYPLHVGGKLSLNNWRGSETVQMVIDDVAKV
ncbi:MAG: single-stranded-DNA-specific exonuclease RecJ, partial [Pseudomonadota bacterium]|nr:single-stranded-DNA-specific exonuclease RecJ [Pseudomonadota bacterium]